MSEGVANVFQLYPPALPHACVNSWARQLTHRESRPVWWPESGPRGSGLPHPPRPAGTAQLLLPGDHHSCHHPVSQSLEKQSYFKSTDERKAGMLTS